MEIAFHGGAQTVTGSKHVVTLNDGTQILLDCGMFQGMGEDTDEMNDHFGFNPKKISCMVLSHAHIDHCGLIPRLVKEGFEGEIYCTAATMHLSRILLMDSARIQMQDTEYSNRIRSRRNQELLEPLYNEEDVMAALRLFKILEYNEEFNISPRVSVRLTDAGHVIGSAAIHLTVLEDGKYSQITFSGDVGRYGDLILKSPQSFPQAEYILLESTYGDSLHKDLEPMEDKLREVIHQTCMVKGGKVIIPAFSVGRTQELLYALNGLQLRGLLPEVAYYVDSPLSGQATDVFRSHPDEYNKQVKEVLKVDHDPFGFPGLRFIESVEESRALNDDPRPCVIISSSGMAEAGRAKHHIKNNISSEKNTILMVGYCEPRSLGGRLLAGAPVVEIFGEEYDVKAEVREIRSMSAHGDYEDLLKFLSCQDTKQVRKLFLVHGEPEVQEAFRQKILAQGYEEVIIPERHEKIALN